MKNKLHILLFCENDEDLQEQKQTGLFAIDLIKKGFDVSILVNKCSGTSKLESIYDGIKVYYTKKPKWYKLYESFYKYNIKLILKEDPSIDIIQVMSCNYYNSQIAKICKKLNLPCLGKVYHKNLREFRNLNKIRQNILKKRLNDFSKIVVNAEYLISIGKKAGLQNITLIYDGIYLDKLKGCFNKKPFRDRLNLPEKTTLVTCVASISYLNKQHEILEKIKPLSQDRQLILVGKVEDQTLLENIKREASFQKISDYIHFVEDSEDYISYLQASDLFLLLGGIEDRIETILQAQALGIPVVLGNSPSSLFLTNASRNGVVLYEDNVLVAQALDRLLTDGLYRQSRAVNARSFVSELYSRDKMMDDYSELYYSM